MELWIISQDKRILKRVDGVSIPFNKFSTYENAKDIDKKVLKCCIVDETSLELGIYSTEKQALEVLDEIKKLLTPTIVKPLGLDLSNINGMCQDIIERVHNYEKQIILEQANSIVYQMPEDKGEDYENIH